MTAPTADTASVIDGNDVSYIAVKPTLQESSAGLMHYIRTTLQQAQEITQVVSEAESIADEASKYCEAIRAQHNIVTKEFQSSVVWTQTMLEMCSMAESAERLD